MHFDLSSKNEVLTKTYFSHIQSQALVLFFSKFYIVVHVYTFFLLFVIWADWSSIKFNTNIGFSFTHYYELVNELNTEGCDSLIFNGSHIYRFYPILRYPCRPEILRIHDIGSCFRTKKVFQTESKKVNIQLIL